MCSPTYVCIMQLPVYAVVIICIYYHAETDAAEQKDL